MKCPYWKHCPQWIRKEYFVICRDGEQGFGES